MSGNDRLAIVLALLSLSCKTSPDVVPEPGVAPRDASVPADLRKLRLLDASEEGDVSSAVLHAATSARAQHRRVVVYVGAAWCEPCQRFHEAAARGDLDALFPDVDVLVYDLNRDGERLAAAGYKSGLIPLFALPGADGRSSGKQIEGGIRGASVATTIAPRLRQLLYAPSAPAER